MIYKSKLSLLQTQQAIKKLKDFFESQLAIELNLTRVSAPLFVSPQSGLNDNLNGIEKPVAFNVQNQQELQIVQSLAKWKRAAIARYQIGVEQGIYTDMNAIRKDEELDTTHSYYVDQWDWEKQISVEDRNMNKLKEVVNSIYNVLKKTDLYITTEYPALHMKLPEKIHFISSQDLENQYPGQSPKERENEICREHRAVFITQIGKVLLSGSKHDSRSPDYDDWELNGDLLVYNPIIDQAFELSSMGIRVDRKTLQKQLELTHTIDRLALDYHQSIMNNDLPPTIGGGIGQSRLCMFFLEKAHIGEVQSSYWPAEMIRECKEKNIILL
jgi:aspartate--ammonia ligase